MHKICFVELLFQSFQAFAMFCFRIVNNTKNGNGDNMAFADYF